MGEKGLPFNVMFVNGNAIEAIKATELPTVTSSTGNCMTCTEKVSAETKTVLETKDGNYTCRVYNDGRYVGSRKIMPSIRFVEILGETDDNPRCVKVYFEDGSFERAVTSQNDTFNLEQGITICVTKKLLSMVSNGNGNAVFNKIVKDGMDVVAHEFAQIELAKREASENEERYQRLAAKKQRKAERRAELERQKQEQEREEYIQTQVEIQVRALEEICKRYGLNLNDTTTETNAE